MGGDFGPQSAPSLLPLLHSSRLAPTRRISLLYVPHGLARSLRPSPSLLLCYRFEPLPLPPPQGSLSLVPFAVCSTARIPCLMLRVLGLVILRRRRGLGGCGVAFERRSPCPSSSRMLLESIETRLEFLASSCLMGMSSR